MTPVIFVVVWTLTWWFATSFLRLFEVPWKALYIGALAWGGLGVYVYLTQVTI